MPAGFGYGAVGSALRRAFSGGAGLAGRGASRVGGMGSGWRHILGEGGLNALSSGLGRISRAGPTGLYGATGAIAGGMYGAVSSDTSVLGGALMGAGIGMGAVGGASLARTGRLAYGMTRGLGRGRAASYALKAMGQQSSAYIRSGYTRAMNAFRGMRR